MRLIAAKGKVEIQAQSDQMALTALKDVTITSTNGRVVITAAKEVLIGAGGSYIRIAGDGIENGTPGQILEKAGSWDVPGPATLRMPLPPLPLSALPQATDHEYTQVFDISTLVPTASIGSLLESQPYRIYLSDGTIQQQGMLKEGATVAVQTSTSTKVKCEIGAGHWEVAEQGYDGIELDDQDEA